MLSVNSSHSTSLMANVMMDKMSRNLSVEESRCHWVARRFFQFLAVAAPIVSGVPFIAATMDLGGSSPWIGALLTYGNWTSWSLLSTWAIFNMIRDYMEPRIPEETFLLRSRTSLCLSVSLLITAITVGFISQFPIAYLGYAFNQQNLGYLILVFLTDSWIPTYSTKLSLEQIIHQKSNPIVSIARKNWVQIIDQKRQDFQALSQIQKVEYISSLETIWSMPNSMEKFQALIDKMADGVEYPSQPSMKMQIAQKFIGCLGLIMAASQIFGMGYVAYLGMDALSGSLGWSIAAGVLGALTHTYLNGLSNYYTAISTLNTTISLTTCKYQRSLSEQFRPLLSTIIKAIGIATACLCWGVSVETVKTYISNRILRLYLQITIPAGEILFTLTGILALIDIILEYYILKTGTEEEKSMIEFDVKCREIQELSNKISSEDFALFMDDMPENIQHKLMRGNEGEIQKIEQSPLVESFV